MGEARGLDRRRLLVAGGAAGVGAASALGLESARRAGAPAAAPQDTARVAPQGHGQAVEPFHGPRQAGVATAPQAFAAFVALDLNRDTTRDAVRRLLRVLSEDAAALTQGRAPVADQEPWLAERPARLTVTLGFGRRLLGLVAPDRAPAWLRPLPPFSIDRLEERWSDGDLLLQICADDRLAVSHAQRVLLKAARSFAAVRWVQDGFRHTVGSVPDGQSMRNLFGQVDGTVNPRGGSEEYERVVHGRDGFAPWVPDGTALVVRRIAMNLDTWDEADTPAREDAVGRRLRDGAPLTGGAEHDEPDLAARGPLGFPVIADYAHVRRSRSEDPLERIHRRVYNYDLPVAGASGTRGRGATTGGVSDAGMVFAAYCADVDRQFVPIQRRLDELDMLNAWTTPVGSAVFAVPPGCAEGGFVGDVLFED
ncbi:Dyp-type peroxidase [Kocuria rosea]|uniref:Dyp-type peroxidase n=1 Tax=Kocuria rosea TaxID=1275 RepID=UPI000F6B909D|nr:Dyp-type peroxidase [Kocuria rosea]VEH44044.1 Peroxidase Tfu_3078 precursor [Kocuria rosea]VEI52286.1 Peroxidase Tfu_3078 precursor [Kocuria rosea]